MARIEVRDLELAGCRMIEAPRFSDERGEFSETWNAAAWNEAGIDLDFVQDNVSRSRKGVLRGLHYQLDPFAQAKVVRVVTGAIHDVAVDLRRSSATFGRWMGLTLTPQSGQLLIPGGFAHGFLALEDDTLVTYKVNNIYSAAHERSIRFDDPTLAIRWPDPGTPFVLSPKDRDACRFEQAEVFA